MNKNAIWEEDFVKTLDKLIANFTKTELFSMFNLKHINTKKQSESSLEELGDIPFPKNFVSVDTYKKPDGKIRYQGYIVLKSGKDLEDCIHNLCLQHFSLDTRDWDFMYIEDKKDYSKGYFAVFFSSLKYTKDESILSDYDPDDLPFG